MDKKYDEKTYEFYKSVANNVFEFANGKINTPVQGLELLFDENDTDMVTMNTLSILIPIYSMVDAAHIESNTCEEDVVSIVNIAHLVLYSMAGFDMDHDRYPVYHHKKYVENSLKKYVSEFMYDHALDLCNLTNCTTLGEYLEICYKFHDYDRKYALPFYRLTETDYVCELVGASIDIFRNYDGLLKETMDRTGDIVEILRDNLDHDGELIIKFRDIGLNIKHVPGGVDNITTKNAKIPNLVGFYKRIQKIGKTLKEDSKVPYVWGNMLPGKTYYITFITRDENEVLEELEGNKENG